MPIITHKIQKGIHKINRIITSPDPSKIKRLNFAVTYRCNSRCKICSIWNIYHKESAKADQELSLNQIKELFNKEKFFDNLDEINLTGGEPFLRKDFQEIYQYLRNRFPRTTIVISTNGLNVTEKWIENKKDIPWTILIFSMDGIQKTNDSIRGIKGSFQRVIKAIDYYKGLYPSLKMGISFTILPENYNDLIKVYDLSKKLNLSFTTRFACNSESYYGNSKMDVQWTDEMLNTVETDIQSIIKEISQSRNSLNRLLNPDLYFLSQMIKYQREKKRLFKCYSGTHSLFIDPYGSVYPCIFSEDPFGNITEEPFEKLWFSEKAKKKRHSIAGNECHCWTECETIPSLQRNLGHIKHV